MRAEINRVRLFAGIPPISSTQGPEVEADEDFETMRAFVLLENMANIGKSTVAEDKSLAAIPLWKRDAQRAKIMESIRESTPGTVEDTKMADVTRPDQHGSIRESRHMQRFYRTNGRVNSL